MNEQWFIVKSSCNDCGGDTDIVGPFDTEKEADDFHDKFSGTGKLWKGTCSSIYIVKVTSPEEIINENR